MAPYNADVVLDIVVDQLERAGRGGQTQLAQHLGVAVQTVNKWRKRQTTPERRWWPGIEEFYDLGDGALSRAAGLGDAGTAEIEDLRADVAQLRAEVAGFRTLA